MIGASPRRKEDQRLLTGHGRFVDDVRRGGIGGLGVVRSAESYARLTKVVTAGARALPGVVLAWSAADLGEMAPTMPTAYGGTQKGRAWAQPVLARDIVRHVGEPVAVVVAESAYQLADALDAVTVEYERLPSLPTAEAALASSARVHEGWPDNTAVVARGAVGDPERAMAGSYALIRERMRHPLLRPVPIETRGVFAYRDRSSGALVVSSSTQSPYALRDVVAAALGLPVEEVRVVVPDVGGGFGPKGPIYPEEILVAAAAHRLGRPVKWVESRRENLACMGHDREQNHDVRIGFARDGTIVAIDGSFVADVGAYPLQGDGLTANTVNHMPGPYRVPHYRNTGTSVVTTKTLNAAYRAAGRPEAVFVMERLMDIGARRLGLDPAEIRRRNFVRPAEMPYRPGLTYKDGVAVTHEPCDFPAAFERALALLPYDQWRRRQKAQASTARRIGIGIACYAQGTGLGPYEGATVRVDPSGKVYVYIGVTGQGQGHATTLAQIAAGELGAAWEDVVVCAGDTALFPFGMGTGGSRVAANSGPAVAQTAREVRERAARVAAELLECAPEDVRIEPSRVHVVGMPDRTVSLGRVAHAAVKSKVLKATGEPRLHACTYFYPDTVTWAFGTHAAAVEVDVETCEIRLLAYAIVHDPGRAINPTIVEGQLQGGAAQGICAGLMEEVVYDGAGQLLTGSLMDYAIPKADQLPALAVAPDAHPPPINALGIKGAGESGAIPGAAAVPNPAESRVPAPGARYP